MRKPILTLMVGAALALTHISAFALTPLSDAHMKAPATRAGMKIHIGDTLAFQRLTQFFYTDTDGIIGSSAAPSIVSLNESISATSGEFSEITRINVLTTDMDNSGNTNELPEFQTISYHNDPIQPDASVIITTRSIIIPEPQQSK